MHVHREGVFYGIPSEPEPDVQSPDFGSGAREQVTSQGVEGREGSESSVSPQVDSLMSSAAVQGHNVIPAGEVLRTDAQVQTPWTEKELELLKTCTTMGELRALADKLKDRHTLRAVTDKHRRLVEAGQATRTDAKVYNSWTEKELELLKACTTMGEVRALADKLKDRHTLIAVTDKHKDLVKAGQATRIDAKVHNSWTEKELELLKACTTMGQLRALADKLKDRHTRGSVMSKHRRLVKAGQATRIDAKEQAPWTEKELELLKACTTMGEVRALADRLEDRHSLRAVTDKHRDLVKVGQATRIDAKEQAPWTEKELELLKACTTMGEVRALADRLEDRHSLRAVMVKHRRLVEAGQATRIDAQVQTPWTEKELELLKTCTTMGELRALADKLKDRHSWGSVMVKHKDLVKAGQATRTDAQVQTPWTEKELELLKTCTTMGQLRALADKLEDRHSLIAVTDKHRRLVEAGQATRIDAQVHNSWTEKELELLKACTTMGEVRALADRLEDRHSLIAVTDKHKDLVKAGQATRIDAKVHNSWTEKELELLKACTTMGELRALADKLKDRHTLRAVMVKHKDLVKAGQATRIDAKVQNPWTEKELELLKACTTMGELRALADKLEDRHSLRAVMVKHKDLVKAGQATRSD